MTLLLRYLLGMMGAPLSPVPGTVEGGTLGMAMEPITVPPSSLSSPPIIDSPPAPFLFTGTREEALLHAAMTCCCSESSSIPPSYPNPCCSGLVLPETIRGNLRYTLSHDTGLGLRYFPTVTLWNSARPNNPPEVRPDWIPREAFPTLPDPHRNGDAAPVYVRYPPAWYSNLIEDFACSYDILSLIHI